jgi:hypothetical protein
VLGAREAVPRMLELFEAHGIRATWAKGGLPVLRNQGRVDGGPPGGAPRLQKSPPV